MWRHVLLTTSILALGQPLPSTITTPSFSGLGIESYEIPQSSLSMLSTLAAKKLRGATEPAVESADAAPLVPEKSSDGDTAMLSNTEADSELETVTSGNSPPDTTQKPVAMVEIYSARTWMEALMMCWSAGGRLAAPRSRQEAQALGRSIPRFTDNTSDSADAMFVAANSLANAGDWRTDDGSPLWTTGYAEWLGGQPRQGQCGALLTDGLYVALPCGVRLPVICDVGVRASNLTTADSTEANGHYASLGSFGRFRVGDKPATWMEAVAACASEGADLALPRSAREAGALAAVLLQDGQRYFVGASDLADEGTWRSADGSTLKDVGYDAWATGEPSKNRRRNCATLRADGLFSEEECGVELPYICRLRTPAAKSDDGYGAEEDLGRYKLHPAGRTWFDAVTTCHNENATLAIPNSEQEARLLVRLLNDASQRLRNVQNQGYMHIGLHDIDGDGDWRTLDGETTHEAGYHNWWRSWNVYPSNNGDHCVVLENQRLSYFNYPCSNLYAFVCEKPL